MELATINTWHAEDCGGACDGCGYIAPDGWYPGPCPAEYSDYQLEWAENGVTVPMEDKLEAAK